MCHSHIILLGMQLRCLLVDRTICDVYWVFRHKSVVQARRYSSFCKKKYIKMDMWERPTRCTLLLNKLFQLNYPWHQSLYYPTNVHNVINVELLKHIKVMVAAPKCFGLQRNHHQGATASAYLKLRDWFSVADVVSAMAAYAAIALTTSARRLYQHWTNLVILAKHWLWLPDDGFFVNRNILEQPP